MQDGTHLTTKDIVSGIEDIKKKFNYSQLQKKLEKLEKITSSPEFWNNSSNNNHILKELAHNKNIIKEIDQLQDKVLSIQDLESIEDEMDETMKNELESELANITLQFQNLETKTYLSGKYDGSDAFLSIHAGQGGTEACDWTDILLRMYSRYCEKMNWSVEIADILKGTEAGISKVTLSIKGEYAYGYLKNETGTHRLVRISPFNAQGLRQTSFAGVEVLPIIDDDIDIELQPDDILFNAVRSSGAGGQNVNKVSSKVVLIHRPTGIQVQVQIERSQARNREIAMKMLRAKLYQIELEKKLEEKARLKGEHKVFGWGNQIRNYVLQPYKLVKDLRTNVESVNPDSILDGNLEEFIKEEIKL